METLRPELKQPRNEHLKDTMLEGSLFHQLSSQLGAFYLDWEEFKTQQFVAGSNLCSLESLLLLGNMPIFEEFFFAKSF